MLPDTSKIYLDQCKLQGMDFDEVATQLTRTGWSSEQIDLARKYYLPGVDVPAMATVSPASKPAEPEVKKENSPRKTGLWILTGLVFLMAASGVPAYFVATEKLNIGSEAFKKAVTSAIFSLPFIQKTPKYILQRAVTMHENLHKNSFDVSLASKSDNFTKLVGNNGLDAHLQGYVDYTDGKNPKFSIKLEVTREFSVQARKNNKMVYVKVDQLPEFLTAVLGFDIGKLNAVIENWVAFDISPLETEARKNLDNLNETKSPTDQAVNQLLTKLLNDQVLPKIKITTDKLDNLSTYKLEFAPDNQTVDKISEELQKEAKTNISGTSKEKMSDYLKNLDLNVWIDAGKYYLRKATVTLTINPGTQNTTSGAISMLPVPITFDSPVTVSIAVSLSDFGKDIPVEIPANSITPEEMYLQIASESGINQLNPPRQQAQSNNTKRRSDLLTILNATGQYQADHEGLYPKGIFSREKEISRKGADVCEDLMPDYISSLPQDPSINSSTFDRGVSCEGNYVTGYNIVKSANGKITVSAPRAELGEKISYTR